MFTKYAGLPFVIKLLCTESIAVWDTSAKENHVVKQSSLSAWGGDSLVRIFQLKFQTLKLQLIPEESTFRFHSDLGPSPVVHFAFWLAKLSKYGFLLPCFSAVYVTRYFCGNKGTLSALPSIKVTCLFPVELWQSVGTLHWLSLSESPHREAKPWLKLVKHEGCLYHLIISVQLIISPLT